MTTKDATAIQTAVLQYTMTDPTRIIGLIEETERVIQAGIEGDFVECGVWRGGSMMVIALTLMHMGVVDRDLWLFDTYSGMPPAGIEDVDCFGHSAMDPKSGAFSPEGCTVGVLAVAAAMEKTGYPIERLHYIAGMVEVTIPKEAPEHIALLHLDTDWYASTRHELEHLYHRVPAGGGIMIDDYGHWAGARKATDEYLAKHAPSMEIVPCGYTAVILRKTA